MDPHAHPRHFAGLLLALLLFPLTALAAGPHNVTTALAFSFAGGATTYPPTAAVPKAWARKTWPSPPIPRSGPSIRSRELPNREPAGSGISSLRTCETRSTMYDVRRAYAGHGAPPDTLAHCAPPRSCAPPAT